MKVALCVHGRFHAFELAGELSRHGCLAQLATTYPAMVARHFLPEGVALRTAPWLEALRRLCGKLGVATPDHLIARRFGAFAAATLPQGADILVGWSGASLEAVREARRRGMAVVIERGSTHIVHQNAVLAEAHARLGLRFAGIDPRLMAREVEEYALADLVVTGSSAAAATFAPQGVDAAKVAVNPYGVDLERFARVVPSRRPGPPRILFVGQVGVRKGVPWLLDAFARLGGDAELHLVGPVESAFQPLLTRWPGERVHLHGPLRGEALVRAFADADLFCLPSMEEGFGMVVLQAMAAGLPVVASTATGAVDVPDALPILVAPGDGTALEAGLRRALDNPRHREAMAAAGRRAVVAGFTWADYGRRAVAALERVKGAGTPTG
ncbi:Glycosyltransferase [Magnetospirillum sp. XM-1]|uniref:glycosyltransferase family 4 protein n=1 Tax=Magnetospirillum sp. XM-1 TaxID=1663591 RepID=UPI00073DBF96|nr:glycosyltransferase family 4 protein [Magnetospirillum sp. XM-1]CUW38094.1 Glycosyltransferase [Magnetospirillum sp. XM-1]